MARSDRFRFFLRFQASPLKIYPGFQRLFMRGFRFRAARVFGLWPRKLLVAREKKPLVPRVHKIWVPVKT